ncbi:MAG: carboxy terminal-processing peptidase [Microscillaceae bacterium]|nr:carboxy terminal-processing peptidase [Microscillaceae bacterium]
MKKIRYLLPLPLLVAIFWSFSTSKAIPTQVEIKYTYLLPDSTRLQPAPIHVEKAKLLANLITSFHYSRKELSDEISEMMFRNFLESLDGNRLYLLAEDVAQFETYRNQLDDFVMRGDLALAYDIYNLYRQRVVARLDSNIQFLEKGADFDFTQNEEMEVNREKMPWPKTAIEAKEIWRKQLKNSVLSLMLSGKSQAEAKEMVKNRFETYRRNLLQTNSEDVFEAYMNALTEAYDPHTTYFSPVNSQNFRLNLNKSFEGIGARLQTQNDHTVIVEIIPGGPASKSKEIKPNDKIIGVAQGEADFVDVVGWRIDDVVALIRGDKGTAVRLQIIPESAAPNEPPRIVKLIRDKIKIEDESATQKSFTITEKGETYRIGVITIPSFYINYEDFRTGKQDYKSTTNDVRRLISELKAEGIDGLIIDLRFNGGGALKEAIDLTGLFIKSGPVVQVRNAQGQLEVGEDEDPSLAYEGPLAVMVNAYSASASEIFAAAIQDYRRGLIIGEPTFGKGTVQNQIDLNRYLREPGQELGQLNLTLSKFYRVTGSSTQHQGVLPDITLPSVYDKSEVGESARPTALPWDEIKAARFVATEEVNAALLAKLNKAYQGRMTTEPYLKDLLSFAEEVQELRSRQKISLNLENRRVENEEYEKKQLLRKQLLENSTEGNASIREIQDAYLKNALQIMSDLLAEKAKITKKKK